jgi:hypothetical protein
MSTGQKTPGDIYAFSPLEAEKYLDKINNLWNTNYKIKDFNNLYIDEKGDYFYLFLVAGHRRLKAINELGLEYLANIHFAKNFEQAIKWQLSENLHEELPILDQVTSATALWVMMKKKNDRLSLKEFANKHVHRSVSWLANALRFSRLPVLVQELIKKTEISKGVAYSILLEFAKLYDFSVSKNKPLSEEILVSFINHCITHKYKISKVKEFCEIKRDEILGQQELFILKVEEINNNSLSAIKRNKTHHMSEAESYLKASGVIARQITVNAKAKAEKVIVLAGEIKV